MIKADRVITTQDIIDASMISYRCESTTEAINKQIWPDVRSLINSKENISLSATYAGRKVMVKEMCARVLITLQNQDESTWITFIGIEENPKAGIQGVFGHIGEVGNLVDFVTKNWDKFLLQKDNKISIF